MNIGIDIRPLMTGARTGVGEYTFELLNAIFQADKTNRYFLFYNSYSDVSQNIPRWTQDNVKYIYTRWPNKLFNSLVMLGIIKLDRLIARKINAPLDYFFAPNINYISLSKQVKFILTIHDLSYEFFPEFYTPKTRLWHRIIGPKKLCRRSDRILVPSENTKLDIVNHFHISPEKISVIYPGLSSTFVLPDANQIFDLRKKYNLPEKFILFLGTIEPRKNIIGIIEAFEKFCESSTAPCNLIIAGASGWKNQSIYKRAQNSPAKNKIQFIGYVTLAEKPALYASAALFVYPSFYEGFGFPVLEAMASGVSVITSNRSSLPEIGGAVNTLVNPNNIVDLATAMLQKLQDTKTDTTIGNARLISEKFNWNESAKKFLDLL